MRRGAKSALIGKWRIIEMELDDDGTINGEISFHLGDESTFKARKW
jgi:hypothetical protein